MKSCSRFLAVALLLTPTAAARAQVPPDKAEATFRVADGLEFKLWASEPLFCNPTCMDIDHKGRVWVCESVNYRCHLHKQPLRRKEGDRIVILEDTKGTGRADKATTFYQAPDFIAPLGIAVAPYPDGKGVRVYICHSPDILVFEDKDGDGKADGPPKKLLSGFGGFDSDHGVHGILIGPDGKLYFSVGDTGVHGLQSSDGKGRKWHSNDTDCRAGTIWRCDLDGKNLELIAHNFRNEYEPCVDSFGTVFVSDNDDDGTEQTRICYVMPGGDYGYHPRGPGQSHWHEEQPGVVPKILRTGFGSPTGMCVYEGTLLPLQSPKRKQGGFTTQLLHTDAGPREVRCYHLKPDGAGYQVEKEVLVSSTDTWFRPSDVCVAPDGSAFVADWYDPGVGGHGIGDFTRGRIYRLAPKGNWPSVPNVDVGTNEGILAALASPALSVRHMAQVKLESLTRDKRSAVTGPAVRERDNVWLRARAIWMIDYEDPGSNKALGAAFWDKDERFRILDLRHTANSKRVILDDDWYALLSADVGSPGVWREALIYLRNAAGSDKHGAEYAKPHLLELAKKYDGKDRFYLEAIGIAVGHHDQKRREIILADFEKHFPGWDDKIAGLVWELRPPSVMPTLGKRLADTSLPLQQRLQIVDILAGTPDTSGGRALIAALTPDAHQEVRDRIQGRLRQFLPTKWRDLRNGPETAKAIDSLMARPDTRLLGLALLGAAAREDAIGRVVEIARNGKEPAEIRVAAIHALGSMRGAAAAKALEGLLDVEPAGLRVHLAQAMGEQLEMYASDKEPAMQALRRLVLAGDRDLAVRQAALAALAGTYHGSVWVVQAQERKRLPEILKPEASRLLRNSPFGDLQQRARTVFAVAKLDPKKLPDINRLAQQKGNADRGKQLLAASLKNDMQCLKCHTVHGVGGQIGPDLSVIGKKASRENLFESILYPSKAIADQYVTWQIADKKGVVLSGLLVEETPDHVTLRDANGKDTKIAKKDIELREKSPKSLMPEDLLAYMTEDELVDIVEYLLTLTEEKK